MSLRSLIFNHVWLKLFSLVLATLIWLAVRANLNNELLAPRKFGAEATLTFVNHPILVLGDIAQHPPVSLIPDHATITVRGPLDLIQGLRGDDIHVFVRLPAKPGFTGDLPVHAHVPAGASVALVTPITILVKASDHPAPSPSPAPAATP